MLGHKRTIFCTVFPPPMENNNCQDDEEGATVGGSWRICIFILGLLLSLYWASSHLPIYGMPVASAPWQHCKKEQILLIGVFVNILKISSKKRSARPNVVENQKAGSHDKFSQVLVQGKHQVTKTLQSNRRRRAFLFPTLDLRVPVKLLVAKSRAHHCSRLDIGFSFNFFLARPNIALQCQP